MHRSTLAPIVVAWLAASSAEGGLVTFSWNDPSGGLFGDPTKWSPRGGPPGASDTGAFDLGPPGGPAYTVVLEADFTVGSLVLGADLVTLELEDHLLNLVGVAPALVVTGGPHAARGGSLVLEGVSINDLSPSDLVAELALSGPLEWTTEGDVLVGTGVGESFLSISGSSEEPAAAVTTGDLRIGSNGAHGTVTLSADGPPTDGAEPAVEWVVGGVLDMGAGNGRGWLNVEHGAILKAGGADMQGDIGFSFATIKVEDPGTKLEFLGTHPINFAQGSIDARDGAEVLIAANPASDDGSIRVGLTYSFGLGAGDGASIISGAPLLLGFTGGQSGQIVAETGGAISLPWVEFGCASQSAGHLSVVSGGRLVLASARPDDGASLIAGAAPGAVFSMTISGAGSSVSMPQGGMILGAARDTGGFVNVQAGAAVETGGTVTIGAAPGSYAQVALGGTWVSAGPVHLGDSGEGLFWSYGNGLVVATEIVVEEGGQFGASVESPSVTNGGVVDAGLGSPGELFLDGNYEQLDTGVLRIDAPDEFWHDALHVTGEAQLDGTLHIVPSVFGCLPPPGASITVLTAARICGQFAEVIAPVDVVVTLLETSVLVTFAESCGADIDCDGAVNESDLVALLGAWGDCRVPCLGDLTGDGSVDGADLGVLLGGWG